MSVLKYKLIDEQNFSMFIFRSGLTGPPQWSEFLATDQEVRIQFPALPEFLRSSGSGTVSTQSRDYN
jgi:hypothetical protein